MKPIKENKLEIPNNEISIDFEFPDPKMLNESYQMDFDKIFSNLLKACKNCLK